MTTPTDATTVLEIVPPRLLAAPFAPARAFLVAAAHATRPLGLEIHVAGDGLVRFCIRAPDGAALGMAADQLRAAYPQAQIVPLLGTSDPLVPHRGERLWVATLELARSAYIPLRLLPDDRDGERPAPSLDPLVPILGALGPLPDGWRAAVQVVIRALPADHWPERVRRLAVEPAAIRERAATHDRATDLPSPAFLLLIGLVVGAAALHWQISAWLEAGDWWRVAAIVPVVVAALIGTVAILAWRARSAPTCDGRLVAAKLAHPPYRAELRLLVIAPPDADPGVARARLARLAAAFRQFDAPGGNHFLPRVLLGGRCRDPRDLRPFAAPRRHPVLSAQEVAALWHLPAGDTDLPIRRTGPRERLAPPPIVARGLRVGVSRAGERAVPVHLPSLIARGHHLLVARTRRGKSALLLRLAQGAMTDTGALLLLDPQGELARDALGLVPRGRRDQVVFIDLGNPARAVGLNLLDVGLGWPGEGAIEHALALFQHHFPGNWGPRMADPFRMGLRTLYAANRARCHEAGDAARDEQYTVFELGRLLLDPGFRRAVVAEAGDPVAAQWWEWYMERALARGGGLYQEVINPVLSKVNRFLASPAIHRVFGQPRSTLDPRGWIRDGALVLIDGAHGTLGADTGGLLGGTLFNLTKLVIAAQEAVPAAERRPITIIADECHALPTADYETVLSAQAKNRANLVVATQGLATLDAFRLGEADRPLRATLLDNVEALWAFQTSAENAARLIPELGGEDWLDPNDLTLLGRYECYCRLFSGPDGGREPSPRAFRVALDPPPVADPALAGELAAASRARWTRPAAAIDAAIGAGWARHEAAATLHRAKPTGDKERGGRNSKNRARQPGAGQVALFLPPPDLAPGEGHGS